MNVPHLILVIAVLFTQATKAQDLPSLFTFKVDKHDDRRYASFEPDSVPTDTKLRLRCAALWNYHDYLYQNYANASMKGSVMRALYPDSVAIRRQFRKYLEADTAFTALYLRSFQSDRIAPLHIDSALRIASRFFYVHRVDGDPTVHFCIGINKVKEMGDTYTHPHHAAFCYMALREMDDALALYKAVRGPFAEEVKKGVSDLRLVEIEHEIYERIAALPELRDLLLGSYQRKAKYLTFDLRE